MDFSTYFNQLAERIKEYTFFQSPIQKDLGDKTIIGFNCSSSSYLRKKLTMERITAEIENLNLPLEIRDEMEVSRYFKIFIKK